MKLNTTKKIKLSILNLYKKIQRELHELQYLFWETTLRCNLSCLHCGSDCLADSNIKDMALKDFLNVLDIIKKEYNSNNIVVIFSGGEPLVRKDIEECIYEIDKKGFPIGMVTNGLAMTEKKYIKLIENGLRTITVSLDGLEKNHNWLRNNSNSYKKAIETIEYIVNTKNINYDVVTCVNKRNINELENIKKLLIRMNVKAWRLFTIFPKGRAKKQSRIISF